VAAGSRLSIVGAGIVGLMVAYTARRRWPKRRIELFDEGPDPRDQEGATHTFGASYSGFDARHVSLTETGPWTSSAREELISRRADEGGWNCLAGETLSAAERDWLSEFVEIASQPEVHAQNYATVMRLNRRGLEAWKELSREEPALFTPVEGSEVLPIVCANAADLESEHTAEFELDPITVSEPARALPPGLAPLEAELVDGTVYGSFLVEGTAYNVKTLCARLISWLETRGVEFHWSERQDLDDHQALSAPPGDVVWAAGVSTTTARLLAEQDVLLQGVLGCWLELANPGFTRPFKVLGVEPTNFINATPAGRSLILSGGYGWVGERPYEEARTLAKPITDAFVRDVARFFAGDQIEKLDDLPAAVCIRPCLPSGVPAVTELSAGSQAHRVLLCVGHAAGGFTQSPAVAGEVLDKVE